MIYNGFIIMENAMSGKHNVQKNLGPLTFGLDIGIASVGWAVLGENRIIDLGVRAFDAAEDKDGKPNNQTRRGARVSRNRNHMRTWRLKRLVRLFRDVGMLSKDEIKQLFSDRHPKKQSLTSPWELRSKGLTQKLSPQEWAQVIYYIVKHRGFKFFSKTEDPRSSGTDDEATSSDKTSEQKEREGLRDGLEYTAKLLKKYPQFKTKTIGYVAYQLANAQQGNDGSYLDKGGNRLETKDCEEFQESFRNKGKSYRHAFHRDDLLDELTKLFEVQQQFGNPHTDLILREEIGRLREVQISSETRPVGSTFREQVLALLELQHPPIYTEQMDALIGDCELESKERNGRGKAECRAAKHSFSNERATWLQTINNLRIRRNGKEEPISSHERAVLINLPYTQAKVTFKQVRDALRANFGFPAHWREASFTKVSYRNKRKDDGSWINVVATDGLNTSLGKYGQEDVRKKANKKLKERLETGTITFAELRQLFELKESETFEHQRKEAEIIPVSLEATYTIPDNEKVFVKLLPAKSKKSLILKGRAMKAFTALNSDNPKATLADLRIAIEQAEPLEAGWQFEYNRKDSTPIKPKDEATTQVPIEYEDAQKAEEETLIELKGWHTFKRALETACPDWWANLQVAYLDPQSDNGQAAAIQIDAIAELLTKAQTDADVANGLAALRLTESQSRALERVHFKQYRNLSHIALRKILPHLEKGTSYTEACKNAGYEPLTHQRTKHLPPLQTYLYERIRHGKKTKYTELRYKDLTNPVVARAFNQARLVLNALIDRYDQSPAYVHVELARDIARPLKGHWNAQGKYIEGRQDIQKKQEENRNKRASTRANFNETYKDILKAHEPTERQILKERLYREQDCKCPYTLTELDLGRVIDDPNYAQLDHIWPRSLTFDNSMGNLVLVHAHANQDKGNRIPYEFIMQKYGAEHWREVEKWILSCKGMSNNKQKRLLAKELDADEFSARNLVDTRYATRLFARMVRSRLLFDGQVEDKIEDIDPSESGKTRLEKFHKTRVRTPQGGLTAFLRRGWLNDIKDRETSDKHHALDACIVAACTQKVINEVNSYFANEEKIPNRFKRNKNPDDGTYTDRGTGEIISKQEARERGLYLPPPWNDFRKQFIEKYETIMVSRVVRKKRNNEAHSANPLAWKQAYQRIRTPLRELTLDKLDPKNLPEDFYTRNRTLIDSLRVQMEQHEGDALRAFSEPFFLTKPNRQPGQLIKAIRLPQPLQKKRAAKNIPIAIEPKSSVKLTEKAAHKTTSLTSLKLNMLTPKNLGEQYYRRNQRLLEALTERLKQHNDDAEKAFKEPFRKPLNLDIRRKNGLLTPTEGPIVRSIRLPKNKEAGLHIRGGIAELGDSLRTEVYWTGKSYFFRPRYNAPETQMLSVPQIPDSSALLFSITQNDLLEVILDDATRHFGYFVMYEGDGRMQIRDHDQPKKDESHRFGIGRIKCLRKFKVSVLGDIETLPDRKS